MARKGVISQTMKKWVKQFFINSPTVLQQYLHQQQSQLEQLDQQYHEIEQELLQYETQRYPHMPKIALFDGNDGIKALYNDIFETVVSNKYLVIKFFASNTFETQTTVNATLKDYYQDIFSKLKKKKVTVDTYLGNGILIMEHISKTSNIENLSDLPAGNSSVNIFIVGKVKSVTQQS